MKDATKSRRLKRGDIVEIEWLDTHSTDRMSLGEIEMLDDPGPTIAYGIVLRNGATYLTLASEFGADPLTDGTWVEQLPHGSITKIKTLGFREIKSMQ